MRAPGVGWSALLVVLVVVLAAGYAAAAGLGLTSGSLFATATVTRCDPDGVTTSRTTSGGFVDVVTVEGIAAACMGSDYAVTLADADAASLAERRLCDVPAGSFGGAGDARTLDFDFSAAAVPDADVAAVHVAVFRDGITAAVPPACD